MHISEGILSPAVLMGGAVLAAAGTAAGTRKLTPERMPQVAVLTAAFFVASLIRLPVGPASTHPVLCGLMGVVLGWQCFPAIMVALLLQALLFQFGGLTTLGVNTVVMALPALLCYLLFARAIRSPRAFLSSAAAFAAGAFSVLLGSLLVAAALFLSGKELLAAAKVVVAAHIPLMVLEGAFTVFCIRFLHRIRPEILELHHATES